MKRSRHVVAALMPAALLAVIACSGDPSAPVQNTGLRVAAAKGGAPTGITVTSASPDSATQDTTLDVVINGSGFVSGAVATWQYAGVADPAQVRTNSTSYVNSRKLVANITISKTATVAKWDVSIMAGSKGGIGTELFAVKLNPKLPPNPTTSFKIPVASSGLGLVSDNRLLDATGGFSVYESGVCAVAGQLFVGPGSGDATIQTNNPTRKSSLCQTGRTMTVVYPVGDPAYPQGGSETMLVFMNIRNISNATTIIQPGYANRVLRNLALNPSQKERCDAWRWSDENAAGDKVWVERMDSITYHVYTRDRDPDPAAAVVAAGTNKALCTTTGQYHNLPADFYVVVSEPQP